MKRTFDPGLSDSTRDRIIGVLRSGPTTVDKMAEQLGLTGNAVRAQLATLQRDGLVRTAGLKRGATRPSRVYELTPELEHLLSRAYIPLLSQLIRLFAVRQPAAKFNAVMREAGRGLAREVAVQPPKGSLADRVEATCGILNRELGATTRTRKERGMLVIRGNGCPLSALTGKHRGVCLTIETLVSELVDAPVTECCDRGERPQCCFEIRPDARGSSSPARAARSHRAP